MVWTTFILIVDAAHSTGHPPNSPYARHRSQRGSTRAQKLGRTAEETCRQGFLTGDAAGFARGDDDFHVGIAVASHNPFLDNTLEDYRREIQRRVFG
jgi:DNA-binding FadR family transcriptional regulator